MRYTPIRIAKILNADNLKCWWGCRGTGISYIAGGNAE